MSETLGFTSYGSGPTRVLVLHDWFCDHGTRLSETWIRYKLQRWRATAEPEAVAKYLELWGHSDISPGARGVQNPMLIIAAAQDAPPFQAAALEATMLPYYPHARLISLGESGHYPMQEQPPLLTTAVERFLGE